MNIQLITENKLPVVVSEYLKKYKLHTWELELSSNNKFNNIVVVPAIQEYENICSLLSSLCQNDKKYFGETLILFVVNNLVSSAPVVKEDNRKSIELIRNIIHGNTVDVFAKSISASELKVGSVDASTHGYELPEKDGGVGLARKIGMDLALTAFDYTNNAKKILICLDADCTVESNYLASIIQTFNRSNIQAAYVQYEHKLPEDENGKLAIVCYEIFLRYYVLVLRFANSPFAFPTIGSTMICDYENYIKVGGMNKKKAAEDFYFMEKLVKNIRIEKTDNTKIYPSSRGSWRVPFGTGQRVNRFFAGSHEEYILYDPKSFVVLKKWLKIFNSTEALKADEYLNAAKNIHPSLAEFLIQNDFKESWGKIIGNSKSKEQIQKQKLIWLDGFRTLKLIHHLRDNGFAQINMFKALDKIFMLTDNDLKIEYKEKIPPLNVQIKYLNHLRKLT